MHQRTVKRERSSWWYDSNGTVRYFWSDSNSSIPHPVCQCGIDGNCFDDFLQCNCDSALQKRLSDSGNNYKNYGNIIYVRCVVIKLWNSPQLNEKGSSPINRFYQSQASILVAFFCLMHSVPTLWADWNVADKWPSWECQSLARICGGSVTPSVDSIR